MNSSSLRGVTFEPARQTWKAQLRVNGRTRFLGRHGTEREAALHVDNARLYLQPYFPGRFDPLQLNLPLTAQEFGTLGPTDDLQALLLAEGAPTYHSVSSDAPEPTAAQKRATLMRDLHASFRKVVAEQTRLGNLIRILELWYAENEADPNLLKAAGVEQQDRPPDPKPVAPDPKPPAPEPPRSVVLPPELHGHEERQPECLHEDPGPE